MDYCGEYFTKKGFKFGITTSQPSLNFSLKKKKNWHLTRMGRMKHIPPKSTFRKATSINRITTSWFYQKNDITNI